jgi:hypothetical protein
VNAAQLLLVDTNVSGQRVAAVSDAPVPTVTADGATATRRRPDAMCPLRAGQPCTLCHPEAHVGPQDCPTVALVMADPDLRAGLSRWRSSRRVV